MSLWITCLSGTDVRDLAVAASHDEVYEVLDDVLDGHVHAGRHVRNVLRDGQPAWDIIEPSGSVLATYWISQDPRVMRT
jgi:hypothetical protein